MKYTPGKWYVDGRFIKTTAQKTKIIAEVPEDGVIHRKIDQANAHLMAAAPKLYEACKAFIRHIELHNSSDHPKANMFCTECPRYHKNIEAAISAAEGK